jgi:Nif-specific regulatory protein
MNQVAADQSPVWMSWGQSPWFQSQNQETELLRFCDQILQQSLKSEPTTPQKLINDLLAMMGAQWAGIVTRNFTNWDVKLESGHKPLQLPNALMVEVLDREASCFYRDPDNVSWKYLISPLPVSTSANQVLILAGRHLSTDDLQAMTAIARCVCIALGSFSQQQSVQQRLVRMEKTLDIVSSLPEQNSPAALLGLIAEQASRLIGCERTSLFLWNKAQKEVVAQLAMGMDHQELRIPDDKGIVGAVIQTGQSARVDDVYNDPRFEKAVDQKSGFQTRNILCVPLKNHKGKIIGAFEAMNKIQGLFTDEDDVTLVSLGIHAAGALQNLSEKETLLHTNKQLSEEASKTSQIIGESASIMALRKQIPQLARTELPVLILGESGTGKEVISRALHFAGPRGTKPFIAVNCAAISETLLESELFGHEKGAFTDARDMRQGKFELADGGSLFLDEIGDLSPGGQAKLLRVLESKVITRVGGSKDIPVNVRILAATNVNLQEAVQKKRFREDLYFRLNVVTLQLMPLRDRPEDVVILAEFFLHTYCQQAGKTVLKLSPEARKRIQAHHWPGNVRELRNLMERIAYLAPGPRVEVEDVAFIMSPHQEEELDPTMDQGLTDATSIFQREFIRKAIDRVKGNMTEAATLLGLHRANLYRKMRQLDMKETGGSL